MLRIEIKREPRTVHKSRLFKLENFNDCFRPKKTRNHLKIDFQKRMNKSMNRSLDRSMDEKLYSLIEANVQITNETISQLEGENDQVYIVFLLFLTQNNQLRKDLDETKEKNAAINELLKSLRKDNEELLKANKALTNTVKSLKAKKVNLVT